ncbi:hypothetical protein UAY_01317 [Enterococcus moraviensis ATCC BAA-383]|uniref:Alpha-ribazole phosphatase n=1 Tax=Enterococcus moraviensis ATCC BAA-383 TaxID=1158609 RepID=R2TA43_9ENTE|nr:histidine phosphatase family protein [Enterococcus moraviensis]EOI01909.1 hypothetical protein UAY_01317 [Enterococcus moraviensis ATCC BAA-383]EOT73556.1 hypothetical protein I586_00550 [Enterococcus moraviensis ATCC BAA-383]OJG69116.1 hypothetical protein RV09_GL000515 [Enterococcus moraviensis]
MIYLVRHGETELNKERKFYGSLDVSLNQTGRQQSSVLAEKLCPIQFAQLYTSGLKRAQETAAIIKPNEEYKILPEFNEKSFGLWEGLSADQINYNYPKEWSAWLDEPFLKTPPKAEEFACFKQRVITGIKQIEGNLIHNQDQPILIVAHLGVLRVIDQYFTSVYSNFWSIDYQQSCYTCYRFKENRYQLEGRNQ